jgi:leucyl aminopeptidase
MKINFSKTAAKNGDVLVINSFDGGALGENAAAVNKTLGDFVRYSIEADPKFDGKRCQTLTLGLPEGCAYKKLIVLGSGKEETLSVDAARSMGPFLLTAIKNTGFDNAIMELDVDAVAKRPGPLNCAGFSAQLVDAMSAKSYTFDKYKTDKAGVKLASITLQGKSAPAAKKIFKRLNEVTQGVFLAANLGNEPSNVLYPESMAKIIDDELSPLGVTVKVIDRAEMTKLGMGAALAVGQGSEKPPCMVVMEYNGTNGSSDKPLALVGKGITFDTGGISLKPSANMGAMKMDMCGSASVVGAMRALAGRKANANVVAIVALAENMPDGKAIKPGDIITSMSGKTVEIINTDAEGRLVLMDALTHIQNEYNPCAVLDFATLTGAIVGALGSRYAGVFSNSDGLAQKLDKAGKVSGELNWRMPLHADFARAVKGKQADLLNQVGGPGASLAAEFLHAVIDRDEKGTERKWAHIDIAGAAKTEADGLTKGFGVRFIDQYVKDNHEVVSPLMQLRTLPKI